MKSHFGRDHRRTICSDRDLPDPFRGRNALRWIEFSE
jgi:hypothetical protein